MTAPVIYAISQTTYRGRWRRVHDGDGCRYYLRVGPVPVRVPWLAWVVFA